MILVLKKKKNNLKKQQTIREKNLKFKKYFGNRILKLNLNFDEILVFFFEENEENKTFNIEKKNFISKNYLHYYKKIKKVILEKNKYNLLHKLYFNFNYFTLTRLQLFNFIVYIGHTKKKQRLNFLSYIYGIRNDLVIFNQDFTLLFYKRALRFFYSVLFYYAKGFFLSSFVNNGFFGMAQYLLKKLKHAYFDGLYVGGVVSNYQNVSKIKKRYFFEYAFNMRVIKRILPSLIVISSTNNYYYVFRESIASGIPSVGFIDSDLEFFDSFYPVLGNNESKAIDFFLIISFSCVIRNVLLKKRLKFLLLKFKLFQFCFRFYFYLLCLKFNKVYLFYYCIRFISEKDSIYFNKGKKNIIFDRSNSYYKKTIRYYLRYNYLQSFKKMKNKLLKFFEKQLYYFKNFLSFNLYNKISFVRLKKKQKLIKKLKLWILFLKLKVKKLNQKKLNLIFLKFSKYKFLGKLWLYFFKKNKLYNYKLNVKDQRLIRIKFLQNYLRKKIFKIIKKLKKIQNIKIKKKSFFFNLKYFFFKFAKFKFYFYFFFCLKNSRLNYNVYYRKFLLKKNERFFLMQLYKLRFLYNFRSLIFDLWWLIILDETKTFKFMYIRQLFLQAQKEYYILLLNLVFFKKLNYSKSIQKYNFSSLERIRFKNKMLFKYFISKFSKRLMIFFSVFSLFSVKEKKKNIKQIFNKFLFSVLDVIRKKKYFSSFFRKLIKYIMQNSVIVYNKQKLFFYLYRKLKIKLFKCFVFSTFKNLKKKKFIICLKFFLNFYLNNFYFFKRICNLQYYYIYIFVYKNKKLFVNLFFIYRKIKEKRIKVLNYVKKLRKNKKQYKKKRMNRNRQNLKKNYNYKNFGFKKHKNFGFKKHENFGFKKHEKRQFSIILAKEISLDEINGFKNLENTKYNNNKKIKFGFFSRANFLYKNKGKKKNEISKVKKLVMYKNKKNFVQKIKLKKYLDLFKFSTQNFRLKDKQKYQYFIVKMIFNLNKFVLRNNLQKMSIENLTNALGLVNRLLGLFLKFQKFFRLKKYKLLQYYRFQYQSSSLIIYLSFINQIEWESTYEFFFFPEELKQDKNLKRIKKFNHVTSFFKRKSNVYKNKKKNYNFDQKDIFLVLDFRKLKKKVYLDFLLLKKKSKFFFFFGLQYLQLYIYLKFLLLLFNDNIVNTKNNFLFDFFFIRFIFLRLIQFSIKRQILWKFFYIRRLRINSKIRRKLFLFGFFQVMQLKKKIKNFIFSNMNYINVFYKLIFIKNKKYFKKNKKKYFFTKNIKNIHKINKKNDKSFSFKSLKK